MLYLLLISNTFTTYAHTHNTVNIEPDKKVLMDIILTSTNSEEIAKANATLNHLIEDEVKRNTFNEIQPKVGVQIKNYTTATVRNKGILQGAYGAAYPTGTSVSKSVTVTINQGTQFKTNSGSTISIGAAFSKSATATINGPDPGTQLPGSNLNATHSVAIAILEGSIIHETFDYYDATTGEFISHVDRYVIGSPSVIRYNLLVAHTATAYHVAHCAESKYKTFASLDAFRDVINSTNPIPAYSW